MFKDEKEKGYIIQDVSDSKGVILGQTPKGVIVNNETRGKNVCVFGSSGSGKTVCYAKPLCLQAIRRNESIIINDNAQALYSDLATSFKKHGYVIRRLNFRYGNSDHWDMLEGVAENPEKAFEIATDIIGPSGDNVILAAATSLLSALIIYVDILSKQKHLTKSKMAALYALLGAYREGDLGYRMKSISSKECENAYMIFEESPSETQDTVYELLSKKLGALMKNSVCEIMNGQSIDLELPAKVPCAYFISFEDFQSDMRFASSTFYHEAFRRLFKFAETQPDGKCRVPVNFLFDEFANIGSIQHLENLLEAGAEKEISVHMILNNIPQFSMLYPKSYLSILDHCAAVVSMGLCDMDTVQYFQHRTEKGLVNLSDKKPVSRKALTPDEICRMNLGDKCIILFGPEESVIANKFFFAAHPDAKGMKFAREQDYQPAELLKAE